MVAMETTPVHPGYVWNLRTVPRKLRLRASNCYRSDLDFGQDLHGNRARAEGCGVAGLKGRKWLILRFCTGTLPDTASIAGVCALDSAADAGGHFCGFEATPTLWLWSCDP